VYRVSFLATSLIHEGHDLFVDQISTRYVNPRLRYYYFQFLKTTGRHIGILLPVCTSGFYFHLCIIIGMSIILHLPTKFHPNRTVRGEVMTS